MRWQMEKDFIRDEMMPIPYEWAEMFLEDEHDLQMAQLEDGLKPIKES
jgi:hypothetical protein